ncbi:MAG: hypothetical protein JWN48_3095 [Myxococcaceae bacterium]|nr:hypothetical protein [Myxococcaceae bacterium]
MAQLSSLSVSLVTGADGRWHPGIGDPSALGWLTVVAYFVAAGLALRALRLHQRASVAAAGGSSTARHEERLLLRFWAMVLLILLLLGVNKQLDLQTFFTEVARDIARSQHWYEGRRPVQIAFILAIALLGTGSTIALAYTMRHVLSRVVGALVGMGALVAFVIIRAASFHHVDELLFRGRIRLNWVLELGGIAMIAISAWRQRPRIED